MPKTLYPQVKSIFKQWKHNGNLPNASADERLGRKQYRLRKKGKIKLLLPYISYNSQSDIVSMRENQVVL